MNFPGNQLNKHGAHNLARRQLRRAFFSGASSIPASPITVLPPAPRSRPGRLCSPAEGGDGGAEDRDGHDFAVPADTVKWDDVKWVLLGASIPLIVLAAVLVFTRPAAGPSRAAQDAAFGPR